jgi:hypothetical protein
LNTITKQETIVNIRSTHPQVSQKMLATKAAPQTTAEEGRAPIDSIVESSWVAIDKAKSLAPRVLMAPLMGGFSAVPVVGLKLANGHRELFKGDSKVSNLAKVSNLGMVAAQSTGLVLAAASAGSYVTGLGNPASLVQLSLGCFAASGAFGVGAALGIDWQ